MDRIRTLAASRAALLCAAAAPTLLLLSPKVSAQVRTDAPDRSVYQSPQLDRAVSSRGASPSRPVGAATLVKNASGQPPAPQDQAALDDRRVEVAPQAAAESRAGQGGARRQPQRDDQPRTRYERSLQGLVETEVHAADGDSPAPSEARPRLRRLPTSTTARPMTSPEAAREALAAGEAPALDESSTSREDAGRRRSLPRHSGAELRAVSHDEVVLVPPHRGGTHAAEGSAEAETFYHPSVPLPHAPPTAGAACDAAAAGSLGCDSLACDSPGCDSLGCAQRDPCWWDPLTNGEICLTPDRWFGSVELLLMFRSGDRLPPLVTTGPASDPGTAGELGQADTHVLAGGDKVLDDMTAGARLTLGTWLDDRQCRSLVLRGWMTGEETYGFHTSQGATPVIARPFFNVSDGQTAEQDTQLVALPGRSSGSIDVQADSNVYGGDLSVRQFWYGRYGATVDFLYGYQYMRLDEDLQISSTSTSLDADFAPLGSVLSITDSFDTENEFHGGQFGVATRYREGCWSFDGLLKFGFGSLRRSADRTGLTRTSVDAATATTAEGLLVRRTNRGSTEDHTFGWVPELDVSLGWHRYPRFDVTCGYHIIAMTDALQPSGAIDPALAVNLSDPPTGAQRPAPGLRYDTFYVHGIHFGLKYVY